MPFTRDLGPSKNQSTTYDAYGNAEDMSDLVTNIDPDQTLLLSKMKDGNDAVATSFSWTTEGLRPPQKNAHLEKEDYTSQAVGSMEGLMNYVQNFQNTGYVTDTQRKVKKVYKEQDEFARQVRIAVTGQARDLEYAIVHGDTRRAGTQSVAPLTGGVPFFMQLQTITATVATDTGIVTCASEHHLKTGDFVYFIATTMPAGLSQGILYYVRLDDTTPDTKFTIFDEVDDAIENRTANQVKPSTAGTALKVCLNNIKSLGGTADFTVSDINDVMQMCYNRGGNPTTAFMSGAKKRRFSQIVSATATTNRKSGDKKMDIVTDVFTSDFGTITAQAHRMYGDKRIDFMDMQYWKKKWFVRPHQVKNLPKKGTYEEFVLEASFGIEGTQPKASGSLTDIKR